MEVKSNPNFLVQNNRKRNTEHDFYATHPEAVEKLLVVANFAPTVWEPCVGQGHIAKVLEKHGYNVSASDIIDRGYPNTVVSDVFDYTYNNKDVVTNPPFNKAMEVIEHILSISENGTKVACLLKLTFLEGQKRGKFFEKHPPQTVYVFSKRTVCALNGDFEKYKASAVAYAWFVWEKNYKGDTVIKWI